MKGARERKTNIEAVFASLFLNLLRGVNFAEGGGLLLGSQCRAQTTRWRTRTYMTCTGRRTAAAAPSYSLNKKETIPILQLKYTSTRTCQRLKFNENSRSEKQGLLPQSSITPSTQRPVRSLIHSFFTRFRFNERNVFAHFRPRLTNEIKACCKGEMERGWMSE